MQWKNETNSNMDHEELQEHVDMLHIIIMVYMLQNNIEEIEALIPSDEIAKSFNQYKMLILNRNKKSMVIKLTRDH